MQHTEVVVASASAAVDLVNYAPEDMLPRLYDRIAALPAAAAQVGDPLCPDAVRRVQAVYEVTACVGVARCEASIAIKSSLY
jgi:hypothetical protein